MSYFALRKWDSDIARNISIEESFHLFKWFLDSNLQAILSDNNPSSSIAKSGRVRIARKYHSLQNNCKVVSKLKKYFFLSYLANE